MKLLNKKIARKIVQLFFRGFFKIYCPVSYQGFESLPAEGSFLLCANQSSHLDIFSLIFASKRNINDFMVFIAQDHLSNNGINRLKKILLPFLVDFYPIERQAKKQFNWIKIIESLQQYTNDKKILTIFPDGTRTRTGVINPFKPGVSYFAHQLKMPVVPVYINGTYNCLPSSKMIPRRGKITVICGKPIQFNEDECKHLGHAVAYQNFANELHQQVVLLSKLV